MEKEMKTCSKCHVEKGREEFYIYRWHKDGLRSECKKCTNKCKEKSRNKKPEHSRLYARQYYYSHLTEIAKHRSLPKMGYCYIIESSGLYKIGQTNNPKRRFSQYRTENPNPQRLVFLAEVWDYKNLEKKLHNILKENCHHHEWFKLESIMLQATIDLLKACNKDKDILKKRYEETGETDTYKDDPAWVALRAQWKKEGDAKMETLKLKIKAITDSVNPALHDFF